MGKEDASQKYIYMLASDKVLGGTLHDGSTFDVNLDIRPGLMEAFKAAKQAGYLVHSELQDMKLHNMNIGWENPGSINTSITIKNFNIYSVSGHKE